jgi:hypothetical protein
MHLEVKARPRFPLLMVILLTVAVFIAAEALMTQTYMALFLLVPPLTTVLLLWLNRTPRLDLILDEEGIKQSSPPLDIPWSAIEGVRRQFDSQDFSKNIKRSYQLEVHHAEGMLLIPPVSKPALESVAKAMIQVLTPSGSREVPEVLQDNVNAWTSLFGEEKVFTYRARRYLGSWAHVPSLSLVVGIVAGIKVFLISAGTFKIPLDKGDGGVVAGIFLSWFIVMFIALFVALAKRSGGPNRKIKNWKKAGLAISPAGLALKQGTMEGEIKWSEIIDIAFQKSRNMGIKIKVAGAEFQIFDLYDRPIFVIYQQIMKYYANKDITM